MNRYRSCVIAVAVAFGLALTSLALGAERPGPPGSIQLPPGVELPGTLKRESPGPPGSRQLAPGVQVPARVERVEASKAGISQLSVTFAPPSNKWVFNSYNPPKKDIYIQSFPGFTGSPVKLKIVVKNPGKLKSPAMTANAVLTGSSFLGLDSRPVPSLAPGETYDVEWDSGTVVFMSEGGLQVSVHLK